MKKYARGAVAALAFAGLVAQPIVANAGDYRCYTPPSNSGYGLGIAWAFGFFLCAGMTVGAQDVEAKKHHHVVTGHDRAAGFISCLLPPIGLARLDKLSKKHNG